MIAVITGDIIKSRKVNPAVWMPKLQIYLEETVPDSTKRAIYRGDSFQLEIAVEQALEIAVCLKALIKTNNIIGVRLAIGIGDKDFSGKIITESNGSAFVNSGESFELLKNTTTLLLKSPFPDFDTYMNPVLQLLSFVTDNWKPVTAETIFYALKHKNRLQKEIAELLSKDSTTVNKALKRGAYDEIVAIINLYAKKISQCSN